MGTIQVTIPPEDIGDPDWVYAVMNEDRIKEIKKTGIMHFISQWINLTSLIIFVSTHDNILVGDMTLLQGVFYTTLLVMANWTGSFAATKLYHYSKVRRAQRRYAVRHGLIPWWTQKEFGGWK